MKGIEPRTASEWAVFYPNHLMDKRIEQLSPEHRRNILSKSQDGWNGNPKLLDKTFKNDTFEQLPDDTYQTKFICLPSSLESDIILMGLEMKPKGTMGQKKNKTPPEPKESSAKRIKKEEEKQEILADEMEAVSDDESSMSEEVETKKKTTKLPIAVSMPLVSEALFDDMMAVGDEDDNLSNSEAEDDEKEESIEERPKRQPRKAKAPPRLADEQSEVEDDDGKPMKKEKKTKTSKKDTPVKKFSPADERIWDAFNGGLLPEWIENNKPLQKLMDKEKSTKDFLQPETFPRTQYFGLDTKTYRPFETNEFRVWKALQQRVGWTRLPKTTFTVLPRVDETVFHYWLTEIRQHCLKVVPKMSICQHQNEADDDEEPNEERQFLEYGDRVPVLVLVLHYGAMEWAAAKKSTEVLVKLKYPDNERLSDERCLKVKVGTFVQMRSLWYTLHPTSLMEDVAANRFRWELENNTTEEELLHLWVNDDNYLKEVAMESFKIWWIYQCFYRCDTITRFVDTTAYVNPQIKRMLGRPIVYANK
jgi:hypothetical protein